MVRRQISEKITSTISTAWHLTTKSDGMCHLFRRWRGIGSSWEHDPKALLGKMAVVGEDVGEALAAHDLHGDAICQAILLIGARLVQGQGIQESRPGLRENGRSRRMQNRLDKGGGTRAKVGRAVEGQKFRQDFVGRIERGIAKRRIKGQDTPVPLIAVTEERNPIKRIDEVAAHVGRLGVPYR